MYGLIIKPSVDAIFQKLAKKDKEQLRRIGRKIEQIQRNPLLGKPLKWPMDGTRRVQVGSFVLVYDIDENEKNIVILDYDHHDNVY